MADDPTHTDDAPDQDADTTPPADDTQKPAATADDLGDAGKRALEAERTRAKEAERRAKTLERELEQFRKASMTEAERAVAEAEQRGEKAALSRVGQRLAQSEFMAAAARRNPDYDPTKALKFANLASMISEDGEPDPQVIAEAVESLIPERVGTTFPDIGQGRRGGDARATDMNALIRQAAGHR